MSTLSSLSPLLHLFWTAERYFSAPLHFTLDLGADYSLSHILLHHAWTVPPAPARVYNDVVVQISSSPLGQSAEQSWLSEELFRELRWRTVFNLDHDNTLRLGWMLDCYPCGVLRKRLKCCGSVCLGAGAYSQTPATASGVRIPLHQATARYIRVWGTGWDDHNLSTSHHVVELAAYTVPPGASEPVNVALGKPLYAPRSLLNDAQWDMGAELAALPHPDTTPPFEPLAHFTMDLLDTYPICQLSLTRLPIGAQYAAARIELSADNERWTAVWESDPNQLLPALASVTPPPAPHKLLTHPLYRETNKGQLITLVPSEEDQWENGAQTLLKPLRARYVRVWSGALLEEADGSPARSRIGVIIGEVEVVYDTASTY